MGVPKPAKIAAIPFRVSVKASAPTITYSFFNLKHSVVLINYLVIGKTIKTGR